MIQTQKPIISALLIIIIGAQFLFIINQALFGDESFYWLESQFLDWSYSELPGWTAWMIRLGTQILGDSYLAVRSMAFIAYLSVFYVVFSLNQKLNIKEVHLNLLLIVSVPIYLLLATMSLPDIWLLFFVIWISYYLYKAVRQESVSNWIVLGVLVACSINVHLRMWIWLFFAGLSFLFIYKPKPTLLKPLLLICLPISLLGLIPIVIFNYDNGFPLLQFQLVDRQPWAFQLKNLLFVVSQILVVSPLVLLIWLRAVFLWKQSEKYIQWVLLTALIHFMFYLVMSVFADGLRTTVHWLIISYIPVLGLTSSLIKNRKLIVLGIITGLLTTLFFVYYLSYVESNTKSRIINNSSAWKQLADKVKTIKTQQNVEWIVTDYFMTASELGFELKEITSLKVLPHEKNIKHGRQLQLKLMGLLLESPRDFNKAALLVVEDSAMKLQDKAKYYKGLCTTFDGVQYLDSVNDSNTAKQYHLFLINQSSDCQIPPLFYIDHKQLGAVIEVSGWAIYHEVGIKSLYLVMNNEEVIVSESQISIPGLSDQFKEIHDPLIPNNGFNIQFPNKNINSIRIKAVGKDNKIFYSHKYYFN